MSILSLNPHLQSQQLWGQSSTISVFPSPPGGKPQIYSQNMYGVPIVCWTLRKALGTQGKELTWSIVHQSQRKNIGEENHFLYRKVGGILATAGSDRTAKNTEEFFWGWGNCAETELPERPFPDLWDHKLLEWGSGKLYFPHFLPVTLVSTRVHSGAAVSVVSGSGLSLPPFWQPLWVWSVGHPHQITSERGKCECWCVEHRPPRPNRWVRIFGDRPQEYAPPSFFFF